MTKLSYSAGLSFDFSRRVVLDLAYCYVTSADPERTGSYPSTTTTRGSSKRSSPATTSSTPTSSRSDCG